MINNSTREDNKVSITNLLIQPHRRTKGGFAKIRKILLLFAVAVIHCQASGNVLAHLLRHFLMTHQAVRAQCKDDMHILVLHAQVVHLVDQNWHKVMSIRYTRRIVANKSNLHARTHQLINRRTANRMIKRIQHRCLQIRKLRKGLRFQLAHDMLVIQGKIFIAMTIMILVIY